MAEIKKIVCLANSEKTMGRCIAGKTVTADGFGGWVRPVSARSTHEISDTERRFQDGNYPQLMDVIRIPVGAPSPIEHQQENILINDKFYWTKTGEVSWDNLRAALDHPDSLWTNGDHTYHGVNDRVHRRIAASLSCSLYLIEPEELTIIVREERSRFKPTSRKTRAKFKYHGVTYDFYMKDPEAEIMFMRKPNDEYPLTETYLTISLSEPHIRGDGNCYKLAAAIIGRNPLQS